MAKPQEEERIGLTEVAQPMLFAQQMGLTEILREANINPSAVFGHSVGEVAAACASGALTVEQATKVIFHRSHEQSSTAGVGKMAALGLDAEAAKEAIAKIGGWMEVAAINGPGAVTVAGDENVLSMLVDQVTEDGKFARLLKLDYPFHTKAMEPIKKGLLSALSDITPATSHVPFISTVTGQKIDGQKLNAEYWFNNVRQPVNFHAAVENLLADHDIGLFIEVGPHPVLKDYVLQTTRAAGMIATAFETLRRPGKDRPESDETNISNAIAAAHANGASDMSECYSKPARLPELPKYQWQRERHWRGAVSLPDSFVPTERVHPLLGTRLPDTDGKWEMAMDKNVLSYLADHVVQDAVLFPAAGYLEMMFASAQQQWGADQIIDIENLQIMRPLVLSDQSDPIVQTAVDLRDNTVEISSRRDMDAQDHQIHIRARLSPIEETDAPKVDVSEIIARTPVTMDAQAHYAESDRRGLQYGPFFQGVQDVRLTSETAEQREALATIKLDFLKEGGLEDYRSHPSLFDSCIQAIIPLIGQLDKRNVSTIPVSFERVRSFGPLPAEIICHVVITRESERSVVANFSVMASDGTVLLKLDGARCQKANLTGEIDSPLTSEWWRPDTAAVKSTGLPSLPTPTEVESAAPIVADIREELNTIAALYAVQALDNLRPKEATFNMGSFAKHARIGRAQGPLLTQLLDIATEAGQLTASGKNWTWTDTPLQNADAAWAECFRNHPSHQAELLLLAQVGESLTARLKGEEIAEPNPTLVEQLHDTAPLAAETNQLAIATVHSMLNDWPTDRPIRILEVGGGSGGLTSWILPKLPAERADYLFTDPSDALVARVERRLSAHKFLRTQTVDWTKDATDLGLPNGYFDLVIGTGLAAMDGRATAILDAMQPTMAEGAKLIAFAPVQGAAATLLYKTTINVDTALLSKTGFEDVTTLQNGSAKILVGTNSSAIKIAPSAQDAQSILIVAENPAGLCATLSTELESLGHRVSTTGFPSGIGEAAVDALQDQLNITEATQVVLLGDSQPNADLHDVQIKRTLTAAALTGAIEMVRQDRECALTVVTRGAFQTANGNGPLDPAEAALWGMGRVIGNEHSGLDVRLIDLHGDDATTLVAEISRKDEETEVQLRDGHRFVNRERITTPADEARHAGLKADTYALDFSPKGGLDSLHLRELTRKDPVGDEVEIAVKAAGLNFRDVLWCMGMLPEEAVEHGFSGPTIGMECAGEVVSVGPDVTHVKPGDRVMAFASSCFGTHVTTAAKSVAKMPVRPVLR